VVSGWPHQEGIFYCEIRLQRRVSPYFTQCYQASPDHYDAGHTGILVPAPDFGGSPNPPTWCGFSEVDYLANEISMCRLGTRHVEESI
jgi:hypothetical protein